MNLCTISAGCIDVLVIASALQSLRSRQELGVGGLLRSLWEEASI